MTDPKTETSAQKAQRVGTERLIALASNARPADVTERGKEKLFEKWEKAGKTIEQARQMLKDSIAFHNQCAEEIVSKLGMGNFRYKDRLYVTAAKGPTVYLRPLEKKAKP